VTDPGDRKVRIGLGLGTRTSSDPGRFAALLDGLEALGFDSLWLSEQVTGDCPDPLVGLAYAASRTDRLKLGTSVTVLPGRNPMLVAKQFATLDRLSGGRVLPGVGLGIADEPERQAFAVPKDERAGRFDEMLPLIRRFWTEESVDHKGRWFKYQDASVRPFPMQQPLEVWLGGIARSEVERCGRLGDGWLPAFATPEEVKKGCEEILRVAESHDRAFDVGHFGALVPYLSGAMPDELMARIRKRRSGVEPHEVVAQTVKGLGPLLERYIEAGASKFVVVPINEPANWDSHIAELADTVQPLET
jgi:probable F420-dependent oxidoreductase